MVVLCFARVDTVRIDTRRVYSANTRKSSKTKTTERHITCHNMNRRFGNYETL